MKYSQAKQGRVFVIRLEEGVKVWHVMEAILIELTDTSAVRAFEPKTGFTLLQP